MENISLEFHTIQELKEYLEKLDDNTMVTLTIESEKKQDGTDE